MTLRPQAPILSRSKTPPEAPLTDRTLSLYSYKHKLSSARLGMPAHDQASGNIVVVEAGSTTAGIVVDEVDQVLTVDPSELEAVPAAGSDAIRSIAKIDDRLVVLLDPDAIFGGVDLGSTVAAAA